MALDGFWRWNVRLGTKHFIPTKQEHKQVIDEWMAAQTA